MPYMLYHILDFQPEGFPPVAIKRIGIQGYLSGLLFQIIEKAARNIHPEAGNAQVLPQSVELAEIILQHGFPVFKDSLPGNPGRDIGISVPVTADPGTKPEKG